MLFANSSSISRDLKIPSSLSISSNAANSAKSFNVKIFSLANNASIEIVIPLIFFKSSTKESTFRANLAILRWAKKKINMPTVAIGGINSSNYKKILSKGANFIACSSYVWKNKKLDPVSAIRKFK